MKFSLFKNRLAKTSSKDIDIDKYLSIIKNDKTKLIIDKLRNGEQIELPDFEGGDVHFELVEE